MTSDCTTTFYRPTLYIINGKATVYEQPGALRDCEGIRIRLRDERMARHLADLYNQGKREEVVFRLLAYLIS